MLRTVFPTELGAKTLPRQKTSAQTFLIAGWCGLGMPAMQAFNRGRRAAGSLNRRVGTTVSMGDTRGRIRLGCSGWNYEHWRNGVFYPAGLPTSRWLSYYAERFETVELNSSFYRLPTRRSAEHWAAETPDSFIFTVKVSRYLTHVVRLRDTRAHLARLLERIQPLAQSSKLGPLLWQLPPTFRRDDQRLATMLGELPVTLRHAIEFRHPSWLEPPVLELLREHRVALVVGDRPNAPETRQPEPTADFAYVRFHYGSAGRQGNYSQRELEDWAATIKSWAADRDVYGYFNNDWSGFAPKNAKVLNRLLDER